MIVEYRIDAKDRICGVSKDWLRFAAANGAPGLTRDAVLGRSLWDFVLGSEVRQVYRMLFQAVRSKRKLAAVPFRCDSPAVRRFMELRCYPLARQTIRIEGRLLREQIAEAPVAPQADEPGIAALMRVCSWCRRINSEAAGWIEIDEAARQLRYLETPSPPPITHGICSDCERRVEREIRMLDSV